MNRNCFGRGDKEYVTVGECGGLGIETAKLTTADTRQELSMVFNFDHLDNAGHMRFDEYQYDLRKAVKTILKWQVEYTNHCWPTLLFENHDNPRVTSKVDPTDTYTPEIAKLCAVLEMTLKGSPFIYQGQEIGMENMEFTSMDQIDDISTIDEYQVALRAGCSEKEALDAASAFSRDNARTPVQWSAEKNAGFSEGEPWLGVNPNYKEINIESQLTDSNSLLSFYKKLTALRKAPEYKETLVYGTFAPYQEEQKNLIAYTRNGEKNLLILGNMQAQSQKVSLPGEVKEVLLNNQKAVEITEKEIILKPYQFIVLETAV